jgi:hypothetical protein
VTATEQAERFAIVALMGHHQVAGRLSEAMVAGCPLLQVDIPLEDGSWSTRQFGAAAIYEITYVSEDVARAIAKQNPAHPISVWTARSLGLLPQPELPEGREPDAVEDEDDDPEMDEPDED